MAGMLRSSSASIKRELDRALADGRPADFRERRDELAAKGEPVPMIEANLIRDLVLGPIAPAGVQIIGARIVGDLELRNARGPGGGACNTLKLEDCDLIGSYPLNKSALDACHSHLSRLSLIDCRTTGIHLSSAVVDGDLILDGLRSVVESGESTMPKQECWIRARGIRVGGSVSAARAQFNLRRVLPYWHGRHGAISDDEAKAFKATVLATRVAFDFQEARIDGSMRLQPGFASVGAVDIQGTTIGGDLALSGADLRPSRRSDSDALIARDVHIKGRVFVQADTDSDPDESDDPKTPVNTWGTLDFQGATIDGPFRFADPIYHHTKQNTGYVLVADNARFGNTVELVNVGGAVNLAGSDINDDLKLQGDNVAISVVEATRLAVHGKVTLTGAMRGLVDFSGSVIDGDMAIGDERWFALDEEDGGQPELRLIGASVGRRLRVSPITSKARPVIAWDATRLLRLRATDLDCYPGWRLGQALVRPGRGSDVAVLAFLYRPTDVDAAVLVLDGSAGPMHALNGMPETPLRLDRPERVRTYLDLFCDNLWAESAPYTLIEGTMSVPRRQGLRTWRIAAQLNYEAHTAQASFFVRDSGDVCMFDDTPIGPWREDQPIRIANRVRWLRVPRSDDDRTEWPTFPTVAARWTEIHGTDRRRVWDTAKRQLVSVPDPDPRSSSRSTALIDLSGLKVGALSDEDGINWTELTETDDRSSTLLTPLRPQRRWRSVIRLNLDGFEYGRTDERVASHSHVPRKQRLVAREDWLKAQYAQDRPTKDEYSPQPYQQLAKVFRATGDYGHADDITFEKLRVERVVLSGNPVTRWLSWLFLEWPFGFGLRTWRAARTFVLFLAVGWAAVFFGLAPLVVDASAIGTVVSSGSGNPIVIPLDTKTGPAEIACDQKDAFLYALDVMVPVLDLRQESRCKISTADTLSASAWRTAKGLYAVGGWIVVSGLILTVSGVVRRQVEK